jgi:hypothetical protein
MMKTHETGHIPAIYSQSISDIIGSLNLLSYLNLDISHIESMSKCVTAGIAPIVQPTCSECHLSKYFFFRIPYIVNPKPATPHITVVTIYSEPKLYTTSTLLKIKEMQRRIIPPIMSFRL